MPRSDQHSNGDVLVREVVRQIADAAPPPPDWTSLGVSDGRSATRDRRPWGQFALVAAVTALLVSGLWLLSRPSDVPQQPADTLPSAPAPSALPATWETWAAETDRLDVQLCHTRALAQIATDTDLLAFPDRVGDLGYSPERARHSAFRAVAAGLTGVAQHPDAIAADVSAITPVVDAWQRAEAGYFGDTGDTGDEPAASFTDDVADTERRVAGYLAVASDPATCWFEGADVAPLVSVEVEAAPAGVACLLSAQLHLAVADFGGNEADDALIGFVQAALVDYFDASPIEIGELYESIDALLASPVDQRAGQITAIRTLLEPAWAGADSPCSTALAPRPDRQP